MGVQLWLQLASQLAPQRLAHPLTGGGHDCGSTWVYRDVMLI
jgi:hypothetical protein